MTAKNARRDTREIRLILEDILKLLLNEARRKAELLFLTIEDLQHFHRRGEEEQPWK
jgi:hypothetical protein